MKYELYCKFCNKLFYVICKSWAKKRKFCSLSCSGKNRKGEKSATWNGGRIKDSLGYIRYYAPSHPFTNGKYILEHRLIMEKKLGRYLKKDEHIHHINGIKNDNRIENLELLSASEHRQRHPIDKQILKERMKFALKFRHPIRYTKEQMQEKRKMWCRRWRLKNPEKMKQSIFNWRKNNKEKYKAIYTAYNKSIRLSK